jgi:osmoprotectant transport system permease protein
MDISWRFMLRGVIEHIDLCASGLFFSLLIALPVGILVSRSRVISGIVLSAFGMLYTVPSLALLALLVPFLGLGAKSAITVLVLYGQFILLRHIVLGLNSISPYVAESAQAMALNFFQRLFWVEIPLALPVWFSGIRIATLAMIGIATSAALIHAGGLGVLIFEGISQVNVAKIATGTVLIALLSLFVEAIIKNFEADAALRATGSPPSALS